MKNKITEKQLNQNKITKFLPKKISATQSKVNVITKYSTKKKENQDFEVAIEDAKNKINDILEDKSIPDYLKKNFIDVDVKLFPQEKEEEKNKKKINIENKQKNIKSEVNILNYINNLSKIFIECQNKFKIYKEEFDKLIPNLNSNPNINNEIEKNSKKIYLISDKSNNNSNNNHNIKEEKLSSNQNNLSDYDIETFQSNVSKVSIGNSKNIKKKDSKKTGNKYELQLNELKAEIYLFKMRYEIYKAKSLFYENIFNTVKNVIDNFSFEIQNSKTNNSNNDSNFHTELNKAFNYFGNENNSQNKKYDLNNICHTLKEKLNLILTQNNKYYYQEFQDKFSNNFEYRNYNFCNKDWDFDSDQKMKSNENDKYLKKLEIHLSEILITINNFLKENNNNDTNIINNFNCFLNSSGNQYLDSQIAYPNNSKNTMNINFTLNNLKTKLFLTIKNLLSVYLTGENLSLEIRSKNNFILEKENEFLLFEQAERKSKILKELLSIIQPNLNKVINNKFKTDMVDKLSNMINFYENFNLILKNENIMLKNQLIQTSQIKDFKINSTSKIVDQFLIFSEPNVNKIKELTDIACSSNLNNKEKLLSAFLNVEYNNFNDLISKFFDLKTSFNKILK